MKRVYPREEVCIGCRLCEVHCKVEHSRSKDVVKAFKREQSVARVRVQENGPLSFALQCRHCPEPYCVYSCLTGAMHRDPGSGVVKHDPDRCVGCWTCVLVCPFGVLVRDVANHRIGPKCDLCPDRAVPACVANCPNEALVYAEEA
ncbi:MAG: 4Fe-4S dicluster domain-containing protein [Chloroflexi bacterium]|nr:4Fe-4S dicluster domain-containing protein [Chloroflexota bacterium]MDA8189155.1 4Fe-4S dicluster domain-containing protein [Dehalococcoidales bacterium]